MIILDAHAHFYDVFDPDTFLDTAAERFENAAVGRPALGCLLLAEVAGGRVFEAWREAASNMNRPRRSGSSADHSDPQRRARPRDRTAARWQFETSREDVALLARNRAGKAIAIVAGWQIRTEEGLEILAFGTREAMPDGLPFAEALRVAFGAATLVVAPWGFGKWRGRRGSLVHQALEHDGDRLCLGDNGGRLRSLPAPRLFRVARELGVPILSGSDPLPFPGHARAVARLGSSFDVAPDPDRPLASLLAALAARCPVRPFGRLEKPGAFLRDQLRLRWDRRRGAKFARLEEADLLVRPTASFQ